MSRDVYGTHTRKHNLPSSIQTIIAALTDRGKLYVDAQLVSSECTSFFLRHNFLVYTTTNHAVRFLPLDAPFSGKIGALFALVVSICTRLIRETQIHKR
jgi:IKI3 family